VTVRPTHVADPATFGWSHDQNDRLIAACAHTEQSHLGSDLSNIAAK
jgi:hypothetical protein